MLLQLFLPLTHPWPLPFLEIAFEVIPATFAVSAMMSPISNDDVTYICDDVIYICNDVTYI